MRKYKQKISETKVLHHCFELLEQSLKIEKISIAVCQIKQLLSECYCGNFPVHVGIANTVTTY